MRGICSKIARSGIAIASLAALSVIAGAGQRATLDSPSVKVGAYEIRNADRGMVKRVKVFHDGQRVAIIVLRKGEASAYCCTADGCHKLEVAGACTTLKLTCDADGVCSAE